MRFVFGIVALSIMVSGCSRGDKQADALDRAAQQSDPAAAAELHNQADAIRDNGSDANLADPASPAQNAMQAAGNAAAHDPSNNAQQ